MQFTLLLSFPFPEEFRKQNKKQNKNLPEYPRKISLIIVVNKSEIIHLIFSPTQLDVNTWGGPGPLEVLDVTMERGESEEGKFPQPLEVSSFKTA